MEERDKLKPCPFCGKKAVIRHGSCGYYAECDNGMCPVVPTTWYYNTEIGAINAWNTRRANDDTTRD